MTSARGQAGASADEPHYLILAEVATLLRFDVPLRRNHAPLAGIGCGAEACRCYRVDWSSAAR
jgi:hypothetical protein